MSEHYVLKFHEIDKSDLVHVGGKGANLGEMTKAGLPVPQGFCVTTWAYRLFIDVSKEMDLFFDQLDQIRHDQLENIRELGRRIRAHLTSLRVPDTVRAAIVKAWEDTGADHAYAVRSSATAEDLPTASFAGQQDTYLNVRGLDQLLDAVRNCWASLFTDRAISYRAKNGFDHRAVFLSVVVQQMVFPQVSGIMFTADPITGHRHTVSIDASFGLGEALVSGLVSADLYQVRSGEIIKKQVSKKDIGIFAIPEGGTITQNLPIEQQHLQALADEQIVDLANLGEKIEAHYGSEQDIEWGMADGKFYVLQSRPITSLYPVPPISDDLPHVLINFGYIQMMTDPMKPLALSIMSNLLNIVKKDPHSSAQQVLYHAGGRIFVDFTGPLSVPPVRNRILKVVGGMDERIASALSEVMSSEPFRNRTVPKSAVLRVFSKLAPVLIPTVCRVINNRFFQDPAQASRKAASIIEQIVLEEEERILAAKGAERIRLIKSGMGKMPKEISKVVVYLIAGALASVTLTKKLVTKVGKERADSLLNELYKSLPGNVTTEFGLELGDLADRIRPYPELIHYLLQADSRNFYEGLANIRGGPAFEKELKSFMKKYGMRCVGEIDITNPRWREDPAQLVPSIVSNIRTASEGDHRKKFKEGEREAEAAEQEIVALFGSGKQRKISRLVHQYRYLMGGMREHHKLVVVKLLDLYKRAIMEEAQLLAGQGLLQHEEEVFYLTMEEIEELLENRCSVNIQEAVEARISQYSFHQKLKSPRVMTSDGEIFNGKLRNVKVPEGAIPGTPVSAGTVEGVARVVLKPGEANLSPGEILVAPYTDPGWTPLFTSIVGLITEVGGMMTHGSVIAREYGIPAVVGIDKVTEIIKDGSYIRVDGTSGFVQVLDGQGRE